VLGYYRAAMAELRVALELVMIGAYRNLKPPDYVLWKNSGSELLPPDRHYFARVTGAA
jgi:hypothetical protein